MSFASLGLRAELLRALTDAGYEIPTPVQAQAIPILARLAHRRGKQPFVFIPQPREVVVSREVADVVCGDAKTCDVDLQSG